MGSRGLGGQGAGQLSSQGLWHLGLLTIGPNDLFGFLKIPALRLHLDIVGDLLRTLLIKTLIHCGSGFVVGIKWDQSRFLKAVANALRARCSLPRTASAVCWVSSAIAS